MTQDWPKLACYCTDVLEHEGGSFTFMHRLKKGINRQSHALKVAKLAGMPPAALKVAEEVLQQITAEKPNVYVQAPAELVVEEEASPSMIAAG